MRDSIFCMMKRLLGIQCLFKIILAVCILSFSNTGGFGQGQAGKAMNWDELLTQYQQGKMNDTTYLNQVQLLVEQSFKDSALKENLAAYKEIAWSKEVYQPYRIKYYAFLANNATFIHKEGASLYYLERMEDEMKKVKPYTNSLNAPRQLLAIYAANRSTEKRRMAEFERVWPFLVTLPRSIVKDSVPPVTCVNAMTILSNGAQLYADRKDTVRVDSILDVAVNTWRSLESRPVPDNGKMQQCLFFLYRVKYAAKKMTGGEAEAKKNLDTIYAFISSPELKANAVWKKAAARTMLLKMVDYFTDIGNNDSAEHYLRIISEQLTNKGQPGDGTAFLLSYGKLKAKEGDFKSAYENLLKAYETGDSIIGLRTTDIDNNMYAQAEAEYKSEALKKAENQKMQRNIIIALISVAALAGIGLLYLRMKKKDQAAKDKINKLNYASQLQIMELEERNRLVKQEEQRKLGMELHDSLAGTIAAVKMKIETELVNNNDAEQVKRLKEISNLMALIYTNARNKSHELYKGLEDDMELPFSKRVKMITSNGLSLNNYLMEIEIDDQLLNTTPLNIKIELLYIIQEAITNIIKHAMAGKISIFIYEDIPGLIMQIADDGRGFEKKPKKWGIGLSSIKERAEAIRGKYEIETDSTGTEIKITVPLYSTLN